MAVPELLTLDHIRAMRILVILMLLCSSLYGADVVTTTNFAGDITTKISERSGKDGKPDLRIETVYRGKTKVMMILSRRNQQGTMVITSRSYLTDGKLVMVESDEDHDGTLESIAVFEPDTDNFEMFTRQPDGTVKPVSTQKLDSIKKQEAVADESMRKLFDKPDMTDKELKDLLETNRQKIEAIKSEKKDGN